ncbi:MAG: penicillin-binding protein, partial [Desulfovibrionaceae bacterium]|nr:penicillin-binding protein [Desulfovibrionaceae bacterium]
MLKLGSRKRNRPVPPARGDKNAGKKTLLGNAVRNNRTASWFQGTDWGRVRINAVVCIFCLIWLGLWGRAWYLQMVEGPRLAEQARRQHVTSELVSGRRGMLLDRNGQVLAQSVEARSV